MGKKRGFTLIELLVVIAIIALLTSILVPVLSSVKRQAMNVICLSRLKQWGAIFSMYTSENDGYFHLRQIGNDFGYQRLWHIIYKPMYQDPRMRFCPTAENPNLKTGPFGTWNPAKGSWNPEDYPIPGEGDNQTNYRAPTGSYGMNRYAEDMKGGTYELDPAFWRKVDVKGGSCVPVLLDCQYVYYWANSNSDPPAYNGDYTTPEMHWIAIDRHFGNVNCTMLDFSARGVRLKELWTLKHNRIYNQCGPWSICGFGGDMAACASAWDEMAPWMSKMPEY